MKSKKQDITSTSSRQCKYLELYNKYNNYVYFIALKRLKDFRDGGYVETAVQETFCRAFHYIDKFEDISSNATKSYISAIANSVIAGIIKIKLKEQSIEESIHTNYCCIDEKNIPEIEAIKSEARLAIKNGIDDLSPQEKKIIEMKYIKKLSNYEIAEELGISYENVCIRILRARKKVKNIVGEENYTYLK